MNDQIPPNNEDAETPAEVNEVEAPPQQHAMPHGLQPPQPTPPVYSPPPSFGPPPSQFAPAQAPPVYGPPPTQGQAGFPQPSMPQMPQQQQPTYQAPPQQTPPQQVPQQPGQPHLQQPYYAQQYVQGYTGGSAAPGGPGMPPSGLPPRKGLPVGAWIGIGAGVLIVLLVLAVGIGFVVTAASKPLPKAPQETSESKVPDPPKEEPEAPAELDLVTLDDASNFAAGPYWGVPFLDGWDIVRFDEQGVNEFKNATAGCSFYTFQGFGPENITAIDDRGASDQTLETALQIGLPWTAATASPEVNSDGSFEMPVDWQYSVEMQRYVAIYPTAEGDRKRQLLLRTFLPSKVAMYAEVECPSTPAGDKAAQEVLDGLTLTEF